MKIKNWFLDVLKGGSLGLGMIPGVSAGTMALIVGIYDRLIGGIANLRKEFKKSLISLVPIGIGAVMSAIICMLGVNYGLDYAPFAIISLFAGLIIGSLPVITKEIKGVKITFKPILIVAIGAVFAAGIGILSAVAKLNSWGNFEAAFAAGEWWVYIGVFVAGFIAAMACIIPGISGARSQLDLPQLRQTRQRNLPHLISLPRHPCRFHPHKQTHEEPSCEAP